MKAYYNEHDKGAATWLRNLIQAGYIAAGEVDERSIADVQPDDLAGYTQCHWFAGLGGWAYAARLAGWPDDRPIWTGSPPCQPYSKAGKQRGAADDRDLWPHLFRLASACRPDVLFGEQVAAAVGKDWLDRVHADMGGIGYACGAVIVPACAVNAPHRRDRLWFVAHPECRGQQAVWQRRELAAAQGRESVGWDQSASASVDSSGDVADTKRGLGGCQGCAACDGGQAPNGPADQRCGCGGARCNVAYAHGGGRGARPDDAPAGNRQAVAAESRRGAWGGAAWIAGHDGKARRVEPNVRLLDHGSAGRMAVVRPGFSPESTEPEARHWYSRTNALKCLGNAIVPQVAAEVIGAYMDEHPMRL